MNVFVEGLQGQKIKIFGGYVRDLISGDRPNDIDAIYGGTKDIDTIENFFKGAFIMEKVSEEEEKGEQHYQTKKYNVTYLHAYIKGILEIKFNVDFVKRSNINVDMFDCNVNSLCLNPDGSITTMMSHSDGISMEKHLTRITDIFFDIRLKIISDWNEQNKNIKIHRIVKMLKKGYKSNRLPWKMEKCDDECIICREKKEKMYKVGNISGKHWELFCSLDCIEQNFYKIYIGTVNPRIPIENIEWFDAKEEMKKEYLEDDDEFVC